MPQTNNGVLVSVPDAQVPDGYTLPTVTRVSGVQWPRSETLTITKSAEATATEVATFTAIVDAVNTAAALIVTETFIQTQDVEMYTVLKNVGTNQTVGTGNKYTTGADTYLCEVEIYVKSV